MKGALTKESSFVLELLFQRFCEGCKREEMLLCAACESHIPTAAPAVYLVDDVETTGATRKERAKVLKKSGAKTI